MNENQALMNGMAANLMANFLHAYQLTAVQQQLMNSALKYMTSFNTVVLFQQENIKTLWIVPFVRITCLDLS